MALGTPGAEKKSGITDAGGTTSTGAFGCAVRGAGGQRQGGNNNLPRGVASLPAEASAPNLCIDAKSLFEAVAASPRLVVAFTASWFGKHLTTRMMKPARRVLALRHVAYA